MSSLGDIALAFFPLFVAIDVMGVLPIFLSLTQDLDAPGRIRVARQAVFTATVASLGFAVGGSRILRFIGVTLADFKVAGGIVLLVLAVMDLATVVKERRAPLAAVGVVPLGIPLVAGPAVLTTLLIHADLHGYVTTTIAFLLNMVIVWLVFRFSHFVQNIIGKETARACSKISAVVLAAFGVMMIRVGVEEIISACR